MRLRLLKSGTFERVPYAEVVKRVERVSIFRGPVVMKNGVPTSEPSPQPDNQRQAPQNPAKKKV
jgi:hypothetical protein